MHTVSITRTIDAPVEDVWNAIDDFGNVYRFHPTVEHSHTINDVATGEGAQRQCDFYGGGSIREEVVESVPNRRQVIDIFDNGPFPLKENEATFELEALDDGRTSVTATVSFVPKYGPVGWLMAELMMKRRFRTIFESVLEGLETHVQTGQLVGKDGELVDSKGPETAAA